MWLFNMLHGIDNLSIPRNSLQNVACNIYFNHTRCNMLHATMLHRVWLPLEVLILTSHTPLGTVTL